MVDKTHTQTDTKFCISVVDVLMVEIEFFWLEIGTARSSATELQPTQVGACRKENMALFLTE